VADNVASVIDAARPVESRGMVCLSALHRSGGRGPISRATAPIMDPGAGADNNGTSASA